MKNKKGPRGPQGERGIKGESGPVGKCSADCKNNAGYNAIIQHIVDVVNTEEKRNGNPSTFTITDLKNVYVKSKVKSICGSAEFQQMAPYKGAQTLINYLKTIWGDIIKLIYTSGGINYLKSVGAEHDWDWTANNPWDEFKKYDIYYWGLGKEYRPQLLDKCVAESGRSGTAESQLLVHSLLSGTEREVRLMDSRSSVGVYDKSAPHGTAANMENESYPPKTFFSGGSSSGYIKPSSVSSATDSKYSILSYVNVPSGTIDKATNMSTILAENMRTGQKLNLYNAYVFEPSEDITSKYAAGKMAKSANPVKPLSFMVGLEKQANTCYSMSNNSNLVTPKPCDPYDSKQIFTLDFEPSKTNTFKVKHATSGKYLTNSSGSKYVKVGNKGDIYKF
jgi:hypothetical protein